ncbi:MAG: sodium/solute symporter [Planctomycetaceae bacterium]|nr:sodium/solute symporter [Planctomycetaceae bacterium]
MPILFAVPSPPREGGLVALDYVAVVAYLILTAGIVWWSSRKQDSTEEFFVGDRKLPWFAVGLSIMATLLSTLTYLGTPGDTIKNGIVLVWGYAAYVLIVPFVMMLLVPFFMRLQVTSAYEYLERRFDYRLQLTGSLLFICLRLGWISLVMYAGSLALAQMSGFDIVDVIWTMGIASTIYACFGGLKAVVWTDVVQAVMLFGGAFAVIGYVMVTTDTGIGTWWSTAKSLSKGHTAIPVFSLDPFLRATIVTVIIDRFFWNVCTHGGDQVVLQRYFSTPSVGTALRGFVVTLVSQIGMAILLTLCGLALLYFYSTYPKYLGDVPLGDKTLPHFYSTQLPIGFGGLILANFLCDGMQTLVSGVNSMSAVVTKDLFGRSGPEEGVSDRKQLRFARVLTLGIGLLCTVFAWGAAAYMATNEGRFNIIDLLPRFNMFLGPLGCLFFIGMFLPRARARTALISSGVAVLVSGIWTWWLELARLVYWLRFGIGEAAGNPGFIEWYRGIFHTEAPLSVFWVTSISCIVGFVLAAILSYVLDDGGDHRGRAYTWREVMRRPTPAQVAEARARELATTSA